MNNNEIEIVIDNSMVGAILGKGGQNVKLISYLINKKIRIVSMEEHKNNKQKNVEKKIQELIDFGIDKQTAESVITNYMDISNALDDNTISEKNQKLLKSFLDMEIEQQRQRFLSLSGNEDLFLYKSLPINYYFNLLDGGIRCLDDLFKYKQNVNELKDRTNLSIEVCLFLLE